MNVRKEVATVVQRQWLMRGNKFIEKETGIKMKIGYVWTVVDDERSGRGYKCWAVVVRSEMEAVECSNRQDEYAMVRYLWVVVEDERPVRSRNCTAVAVSKVWMVMGKYEDVGVTCASVCGSIILFKESWKIELFCRLQSVADGYLQVSRNAMIVSELFDEMHRWENAQDVTLVEKNGQVVERLHEDNF